MGLKPAALGRKNTHAECITKLFHSSCLSITGHTLSSPDDNSVELLYAYAWPFIIFSLKFFQILLFSQSPSLHPPRRLEQFLAVILHFTLFLPQKILVLHRAVLGSWSSKVCVVQKPRSVGCSCYPHHYYLLFLSSKLSAVSS